MNVPGQNHRDPFFAPFFKELLHDTKQVICCCLWSVGFASDGTLLQLAPVVGHLLFCIGGVGLRPSVVRHLSGPQITFMGESFSRPLALRTHPCWHEPLS